MINGVILKGVGGSYEVKTNDAIVTCKARGIFRKDNIIPLTGDKVIISLENKENGVIENILPRKNELIRPKVSNIDQVIIVMSVMSPNPDLILLDKILVTAESKNIEPVICFNKIDLTDEISINKLVEQYLKTNYKIIRTSFEEDNGLYELVNLLKDKVSALAGQSGVGKSTILNKLMQRTAMETGNLSLKNDRGRHTTRHTELFQLENNGLILDTPGFSSYELENIKYDELTNYYPEFQEFLQNCRYSGCSHISDDECGVRDALQNGLINGHRYSRYCIFYLELKQKHNTRYS